MNHECVTAEEYLPGDFQKYINNNGSICLNDFDITEKIRNLCLLYIWNI